jgi:hypothetical protein
MSLEPSSSGGSFPPPPPPIVKNTYYWFMFGHICFVVVTTFAAFFVREDKAEFYGALSLGLAALISLGCMVIKDAIKGNAYVLRILSATGYKPEERLKSIEQLKKLDRRQLIITIGVFAAAVVLLGFLVAEPVYYLSRTRAPKSIEFESLDYYNPTRDEPLIERSPFFEAVIAYLKEATNTGIVLGTMKAFPHPTPKLRVSISVDDQYAVAGYAFREHLVGQRLLHEPIRVSTARAGFIDFFPLPCDPGDKLFFLGRLTLKDTRNSFPSNLNGIIKISVSEVIDP